MNFLRQMNLNEKQKTNDESKPIRYLWIHDAKKETKKTITIKLTEESLRADFREEKVEEIHNNKKKVVVKSFYEEKDGSNDLEYRKLKRYVNIIDDFDRFESDDVAANLIHDFIEAKIENRIEYLASFIATYFEELGYGKKDEFTIIFELI